MIYKVLYQENPTQVPVRENTKCIYIEADSEREVRKKLSKRPMMIEFVQLLEGAHLAYEQASENYKVEQ
ncbi:DNA-directed RNA polymerase subunit epsilon [Chryseomicrobium sp. FSL W7-1435]|uniref:DNA-dependent RNA polymerase subunit epsilon n=1 Tax=Chryseomicrobium sp. FSL W7-1435 TaxID=2921704 RepID=UPI00315A49BE